MSSTDAAPVSVTPATAATGPIGRPGVGPSLAAPSCPTPSPFGVFEECPLCGGTMAPEHAHYKCRGCGWRDSCCD